MFSVLTFLIGIICTLFKSKKELIIQLHVHKKELEILKRLNQQNTFHPMLKCGRLMAVYAEIFSLWLRIMRIPS